jgi:hypothetical protein
MIVKKPNFFLRRRLSLYLPLFFVIFLAAVYKLPRMTIAPVDLTIFALSTALLGLFVGYVLSGLDKRTEQLTAMVRQEAVAIYKMEEHVKNLPEALQADFMQQVEEYLRHKNHNLDPKAGAENYQALLELCQKHDSNPACVAIQTILVDNQLNRSAIASQLSGKVYSHEWLTMYALGIVSLSLLLTFDYGSQWLIKFAAALLAASLALSLMIVWKLNVLGHKKAWKIWEPFVRLIASDFQDLN